MKNSEDSKPWWREPWPWILMAGPAAAIAGCVVTIVLAVSNFSSEPIFDGGIKRGLVVQRVDGAPAAPLHEQSEKEAS